jgi:uncharacterized protein (DUF433 family)
MSAPTQKIAFDDALIRDVLALAPHRDKLRPIVEAASELPDGSSFASVSRHVAEKVGLSPEEADRILTTLRRTAAPDEADWLAERIRHATSTLRQVVNIDPDVRGGVPVLRGTRFTLAQLLAELAEGRSVSEIADAFRLNKEQIQQVLESLATYLDRSAEP